MSKATQGCEIAAEPSSRSTQREELSVSRESIGITALGYYLPPTERRIAELVKSGLTASSEAKLVQLGFGAIRVAEEESVVQLASKAVRDLQRRSGFDLGHIDVLLYAGALATSSVVETGGAKSWNTMVDPTPLFRFPGTCLQGELGVPNATVIGIAQLACNTFQAAIRVARALLVAEPSVRHVLCVAADRFSAHAKREIVYNLMSDGACAAVVSGGQLSNRILATAQITRGAYWDSTISHDQLIAAYFPLARRAILEAVAAAGLRISDIDLLIPHNLNVKSWRF